MSAQCCFTALVSVCVHPWELSVGRTQRVERSQLTNLGGDNSAGPHEYLAEEEGTGITKSVGKAGKEAPVFIQKILTE